jgi:hypothetical protein
MIPILRVYVRFIDYLARRIAKENEVADPLDNRFNVDTTQAP